MSRSKKMIALSGAIGVAFVVALAMAAALAQPQRRAPEQRAPAAKPAPAQTMSAVHRDIERTLGTVPAFMRAYPEAGLAGAWQEMKALQLNPDTALTGKQKELIGLAVAAQIPCEYCVYFHTEAARLYGASDAEIREGIAVGARAVHTATLVAGLTPDEADRADIAPMIERMGQRQREPRQRPAQVTDARGVYRDVQATLGTVPAFIQRYPRVAAAGAWTSYRDLVMSDQTELPRQTKELVAAAVGAQAACEYCVQMWSAAAKQAGANDQKLAEAMAMAAVTRHWSTVLNGNQIDEDQFRSETRQIMRHLQQQARRSAQR